MNRSILMTTLLLAAGSAATASAQVPMLPLPESVVATCNKSCGDACPSVISGDLNPSLQSTHVEVDAVVEHYGLDMECNVVGETDCFAMQVPIDGTDLWHFDSLSRRMVNAILLADRVPFWGDPTRTWEDVTRGEGVTWIEPDADCNPFMVTWGTSVDCHIEVSHRALLDTSVWMRAASFVHEVRHCHDVVGTDHGGECLAGSGSCDETWADAGAYQWAVAFLAQFATSAPASFSPTSRASAIVDANRFLTQNFETDPGFRLFFEPETGARRWTAPLEGFRFEPIDDYALTRIELHLEQESLTGDRARPVVTGILAIARRLYPDGTLGSTTQRNLGELTTDPARIFVIDTADVGPNRVIRQLAIGWEPDASEAVYAERVAVRMVTGEVNSIGQIVNVQTTAFGGSPASQCGGVCTTPQVCNVPLAGALFCSDPTLQPAELSVVTAPVAEFLSGITVATSLGQATIGLASESQLPSVFAELPSTAQVGFSSFTSCPVDTVAVGLLAADDATGGDVSTGFFGLLCVPQADVLSGGFASQLTLVYRSYYLDGVPMFGGSATGIEILSHLASLTDRDAVLEVCPDGQALGGLRAHSSSALNSVDTLFCRAPDGAWFSEVPVGAGGTGGQLYEAVCLHGTSVTAFRSAIDGPTLTSLAMLCQSIE